jgi:hypothetical protein
VIPAKQALFGSRLRRVLLTLALVALSAVSLPVASSAAPAQAAWKLSSIVTPTKLIPGESGGRSVFVLAATNVGSQPTAGTFTFADELPEGLSLYEGGIPLISDDQFFRMFDDDEASNKYACSIAAVSCSGKTVIQPGERLTMYVPVVVAPDAPPVVTSRISIIGGAVAASKTLQTTVSSDPPPFGIEGMESELLDAGGDAETHAGAHPYQLSVGVQFNSELFGEESRSPENPKSISADLPPGVLLNPEATSVHCAEGQLTTNACPSASAVGVAHITINVIGFGSPTISPIYNMETPQGRPAELGFNAAGLGIFIHLLGHIRSDGDYELGSDTLDIPQFGNLTGVTVELWGDPSDPSHDYRRGQCGNSGVLGKACPTTATHTALLTMPSACSGPLVTKVATDSWQHRGNFISATAQTQDATGNPVGVNHCEDLPYDPVNEIRLSTDQAETGTALDFNVDFPNNGLINSSAIAESTTKKVVVTLPEGLTINPSVGEGLGFCRPGQYKKETLDSIDGEGCPSDSKLGTVHVDTPLLHQGIDGSVYLAQQDDPTTSAPGAENPFDTDIALYLVLRNSALGVLVKQALKVEADPRTGQLVTTLEGIPPLPFNHFNFHFREGARAALISPSACGKYATVAKFYPYSDPSNPKTVTSDFEITKGVSGSPCPPAGLPPFTPEFQAGSLNSSAKSYSPFNMRLLRHDGEQDMTKFSAVLPPGVLGKLAGISKCSDADVASAKTKTGSQEKASPSCPANSLIGHTIAGAGVGDSLTYVAGQLYMGGPYNGDPLSVISITPALAGPFDAGTVVVREALTLNPETAEVEVDGKSSDPIPHILKGIVLKVRELRVHVDRPDFILNPTSCDPSSAKATLFGAFRNVFDPSDDVLVGLSTRFQAVNCASLPFKPKLSLELHGGNKRGGHPALKAVVKARESDANIGEATVTLPRSAFLDQAHIRTICTRIQFAANGGNGGGCPQAAQYGYAKAFTPLLDEPVEGPVYLRSSNHKLPDLVAALHGLVNVDIVGKIDSYKGGIRSSFETVPDAPVSRFVLNMQGGKKGLVVNSRNLCASKSRALANFTGQNGVPYRFNPVVRPSCGKRSKGHRG